MMRIKVGTNWFECEPGQPIMVEINAAERAQIASMHPEAKKYAHFHSDDVMTTQQKFEWMDADGETEIAELVGQLQAMSEG